MPTHESRNQKESEGDSLAEATALAEVLFGEPKVSDLRDPKKRKAYARIAKQAGPGLFRMTGITRDQIVRFAVMGAVGVVLLAILLWFIGQVIGWFVGALITLAVIGAVGYLMVGAGKESTSTTKREEKLIKNQELKADREADRALEELEKRLKQ